MRHVSSLVVLVSVASGGCFLGVEEETVDIAGVYRVDRAYTAAPCAMDLRSVTPGSPYVAIDLFEGDYWLAGCTTMDADVCMDPSPPISFSQPFDDRETPGWIGSFASALSENGFCRLRYIEHAAYAFSETALEVDISEYSTTGMFEPCTVEEADRRNIQMPCVAFERLETTRL